MWNHRPLNCLFNCLFWQTSKETLLKTKGIHQWLEDSPHKGSIMRKALVCDDLIMFHRLAAPEADYCPPPPPPPPPPLLSIKTIFPRYGNSNVKDKTVMRPSCLVHPGVRDKRLVSDIDLSQPRHETTFWWRHNGPVTSQLTNSIKWPN